MSIVPRLRNSALKIGSSLKAGTMSILSWYSRANSVNARQIDQRMKKVNKDMSNLDYKPHEPVKQVWHSLALGSYLAQSGPSFTHQTFIECLPSFIQHVCEVLLRSRPGVCKRMRADCCNLRTKAKDAVCYRGRIVKGSLTKASHCSCPQTKSSVMAASAGNIESAGK